MHINDPDIYTEVELLISTPELEIVNYDKSVTSISSRSRSEAKSVTFDDEEEPIISFQQRLKQFGTPPQVINPTNH